MLAGFFFFFSEKKNTVKLPNQDNNSSSGHELSDRSRKIAGNAQKVVERKQASDKTQLAHKIYREKSRKAETAGRPAVYYDPGMGIQEVAHRYNRHIPKANEATQECY